jgi:hypothetical protein
VIFEHESYGEDFRWKNDVRFSAATETGLAKKYQSMRFPVRSFGSASPKIHPMTQILPFDCRVCEYNGKQGLARGNAEATP